MSRYYDKQSDSFKLGPIIRDVLIALVALLLIAFAGGPHYNVWQQGLKGEAELKRAEQNRRIAVLEAEAKLDAAKAFAKAEVERAKGVAEANRIIADGLKGQDEYLRYLWIDKIADHAQREVIYVPTEAAIPLLEATRLKPTPEAPR